MVSNSTPLAPSTAVTQDVELGFTTFSELPKESSIIVWEMSIEDEVRVVRIRDMGGDFRTLSCLAPSIKPPLQHAI
jgi:hypothetical protein